MSRPDAASINFNLPPEVIKEYFEGLAKVEAAKHAPGSDKSFDWSSLLAFAPLFLTILSNLSKSSDSPKSVRVPEKHHESNLSKSSDSPKSVRVPEKHHESKESAQSVSVRLSSVETENKPDIVISVVQKPGESASVPFGVKMTVEASKEEMTPESEVEESEGEKSVTKEGKDKEEKKPEEEKKVQSAKSRRPVYQDGDNVVLDLKDLTEGFGANGGAPLVDMMKMFGPMMEGLMGGMAGTNAPKSDKPVESVSKQTDAVEGAGDATKPELEEELKGDRK